MNDNMAINAAPTPIETVPVNFNVRVLNVRDVVKRFDDIRNHPINTPELESEYLTLSRFMAEIITCPGPVAWGEFSIPEQLIRADLFDFSFVMDIAESRGYKLAEWPLTDINWFKASKSLIEREYLSVVAGGESWYFRMP